MSYASLFLHHRGAVVASAIIGAVIFLAGALLWPLEYSATTRLLIIPTSSLGVDPYTAIKSAERISENLSQVVHTSSFYDQVLKTKEQFKLDDNRFQNLTENNRRKAWDKMVIPQVVSGTSLFAISVYHTDKAQAANWASSIAYSLANQGFEYTGNNVQIKIVDSPVVSRFVSRPNFPMVGLVGLIIGALLGAGYVLAKYE